MLEARLIVKLVKALTLWETPPYYTNDAQDYIEEAVAMAADSEWEKRVSQILEPEYDVAPTYEELLADFMEEFPGLDKDKANASSAFAGVCRDVDKAVNDRIERTLRALVDQLCTAIGDKVHRRNMQIADLKQQLAKRQ